MPRSALFPPELAQAVRDTGFSPAVRAGEFIYLTGATGGRSDGTMPETTAEQAEIAFSKIATVLSAAGETLESITEVTSYFTDIERDFEPVEQIFRRRLAPPLPAWTAVEVARLRRPGALIELRIIAHSPPTP